MQTLGEEAPWRKRWRYPRSTGASEDTGDISGKRASLYRLKTLLLIAEAGLAVGLLVQYESLAKPSENFIVRLLFAALALSIGAFFLQFFIPTARLLRLRSLERIIAPMISDEYLLLTPSVLMAGVGAGALGGIGDIGRLVLLLLFGGMWAVTLFGLSSMFNRFFSKPRSQCPPRLIWAILLTAIPAHGVTLISHAESAARGLVLIFLAPIASVLAGIILTPSLLHPFTWHHIRDSRLPIPLRTLLATFALTGVLPLGGLAVPFWIWARHRLWPRYEQFAELR